MTNPTDQQLDPGVAVYTPGMLRFYDLLVHGISNRLLWRCPTQRLVQQYDRWVSAHHLDVGPGTGLLLERCRFPVERPDVTLLDASPTVLVYAARRLARLEPRTVQADVRGALPLGDDRFGSIGLSYVLHCIPGTMADKTAILVALSRWLEPGGVLFGSTILGFEADHTRLSRAVLGLYNRKQIFANASDGLREFEAGLAQHFEHFDIETVGAVAVFTVQAQS